MAQRCVTITGRCLVSDRQFTGTSNTYADCVGLAGSFGEQLRRARDAARLTQEQLARRSGLSVRSVADLERSRVQRPRWTTVDLLADALDLRGDDRDRFVEAARDTPEGVGPLPRSADGTPEQLPAGVVDFVGREPEQRAAVDWLSTAGGVPLWCLCGPGGVGKTTLGRQVAHLMREQFPDGRLHIELGAMSDRPADPHDRLADLLVTLGVHPHGIPADTSARSALLRSRLAGRRCLVVIDDAPTADAAALFFPGSAGSAVIVTSRARLGDLDGARHTLLEPSDPVLARTLLSNVVGAERIATDPGAASDIVELCGRLPLAVRIAGARLAAAATLSLGEFRDLLADDRDRLDELAVGDRNLRVVLERSVDRLGRDEHDAFLTLGAQPVTDLPAWLLAADPDISLTDSARLLERLATLHLVQRQPPGPDGVARYRMHDLVRLLATERAEQQLNTEQRIALLEQSAAFWLALVDEANARLPMTPDTSPIGSARRAVIPDRQLDRLLDRPFAWFDSEHRSVQAVHAAVVAAASTHTGLDDYSWELPSALKSYWHVRSDVHTGGRMLAAAGAVCRRTGNRRGEAVALLGLGARVPQTERLPPALARVRDALLSFREIGDDLGTLACLIEAADLARRIRPRAPELDEMARTCYDEGLTLARSHGWITRVVDVQQGRALMLIADGRLQEAEQCLLEAKRAVAHLAVDITVAQLDWSLARVYRQCGRQAEAETLLRDSLAVARRYRDTWGQATLLVDLGDLLITLGREQEGHELLREAGPLAEDMGHSDFTADIAAAMRRATRVR